MSDQVPQMDQMDDGGVPSRAVLVVIGIAIALIVGGFSMFFVINANHARSTETEELVKGLVHERDERVNQDCIIFEGNQQTDVDSLMRTYDYLTDLTSAQLQEPLNRVILNGLTRTEAEAKLDDAPDYCDEPNVGLPEPDPKMPTRPRALDELLADD